MSRSSHRLSQYDAGQCDALARVWLIATNEEYHALRWAAKTADPDFRDIIGSRADGAAELAERFQMRLRLILGDDAQVRRRCLDAAYDYAEYWEETRVRGRAFAAASGTGSAPALEPTHA